ncbi:MAG: hypothetical protein J6W57_01975, partial [Oscillospiraceae bacterium]|nr:hypothetical protein [Oscillospiraceae bacterium]
PACKDYPEDPDVLPVADLSDFADRLEKACFDTMESGIVTRDLTLLMEDTGGVTAVDTETFIKAVRDRI